MKIGVIGQGWVGKPYADWFEAKGHRVTRYAIDPPYNHPWRMDEIRHQCRIVFIAVPTPTVDGVCILDNVISALHLIETIAVVKSTMPPGSTRKLQGMFPEIIVMYAPEFLREAQAMHDVESPERTIIGITSPKYRNIANYIFSVMPPAKYRNVCHAETAELTKYAGNVFLTMKVLFANMLYDLSKAEGISYETLRQNLMMDTRIGESHLQVIHSGGRGAGGHCFPKDFDAFIHYYEKSCGMDKNMSKALNLMQDFNNTLLHTYPKA